MSTQPTPIECLRTSGEAPFEDAIEMRIGPVLVTLDRDDATRLHRELGRLLRAARERM